MSIEAPNSKWCDFGGQLPGVWVSIGEYAFIGAGSVVNFDVPNFALIVGVAGKQIGWMSIYGERLDLPLNGYGNCLQKYR